MAARRRDRGCSVYRFFLVCTCIQFSKAAKPDTVCTTVGGASHCTLTCSGTNRCSGSQITSCLAGTGSSCVMFCHGDYACADIKFSNGKVSEYMGIECKGYEACSGADLTNWVQSTVADVSCINDGITNSTQNTCHSVALSSNAEVCCESEAASGVACDSTLTGETE